MALVELMLALTLGLLLFSFLLEIYFVSQRSDHLQMALNHIEYRAKGAISILDEEIHQAGYLGCPRLSDDFPMIAYPPYSMTLTNKLTGNDLNEIEVRHASLQNAILAESMHDSSSLYATQDVHFEPLDILLIADCKQAEIFQAGAISISHGLQKIIALHPLHNQFERNAEISRFAINKFFIAKTERIHPDGTSVYALFMQDIRGFKIELVDEINHMQIRYVVTQDGKLVEKLAHDVSDWSSVTGVAIDLELASPPIQKTWHMYVVLTA